MRQARRNDRHPCLPCASRPGVFLLVLLLTLSGCRHGGGGPSAGYAFVAVAGAASVAVADLASFTVVRHIPLRGRPVQLVSDPTRRTLYVMGEGGSAGLTVIDTAKLEIRRSLWLAEKPQRLRLSPDGKRLYVLDGRSYALKTLDPETLMHGREIRLPKAPVDLDISPDGRWACVSLASDEVTVLDLANWKVTATVPVGREPASVAVRFDGRQAFVANRADRNISVIDLTAGRLVAHLPLGTRPEALRFKPDGGELFVSGGDGSVVVIISAYRDEINQPLLAGAEPRDIAISRDNLLFVANSAANTVSVINIDDRRTLAAVPVGEEPHRVVLTPDDQHALVLNRKSGDMAVVRRSAPPRGRDRIQPPFTLFTLIPVGSHPVDLAVQAR